MKFSKFNVYKKYNDQEYWVFNTLTTALIILENEKFMKALMENMEVVRKNRETLNRLQSLL